jgi:hypothetical protein
MSHTLKQVVETMLQELGPLDQDEAAAIEGAFYGNLFHLAELGFEKGAVPMPYDPRYDLTAGELRAAGANGIDPSVPDGAWVPRHAMRMGDVRTAVVPGSRGPNIHIEYDVSFVEPFLWAEIQGKIVE